MVVFEDVLCCRVLYKVSRMRAGGGRMGQQYWYTTTARLPVRVHLEESKVFC